MTGEPDVASRFASGSWAFTPAVIAAFDEHVEASVPYYGAIQAMVAEVSDWLAPAGSLLADLGAATGTTAAAIEARHPQRQLRYVLYDEEPGMLTAARRKLDTATSRVRYEDIRLQDGPLRHHDAALTIALFTFQFLLPAQRRDALCWARLASADDGALLLAEKLRLDDPRWAEIAAEASWDYKHDAGIDADAIRAKARALRGVLIPLPAAETERLLVDAGWQPPAVLFRWHQWVLWGTFAAPVDREGTLHRLTTPNPLD